MGVEISESPLQTFQFVNEATGQVVAVMGGSTVEEAPLVLMNDTGALDQYWTARVFNGEMLVGNAKSFLYIAVQHASKDWGVPIVQSQARSGSAKWQVEPEGEVCRIRNAHSGWYMSVGEADNPLWAPLVQQPYGVSKNQKWIRRPVKTIRVSVGATINGEPTVYCNPLVTRMPRGERNILLSFVLDAEFRSDWMFPTEQVDDCFYGITIADGSGTQFVEPRCTGEHRVVVIDKNLDAFETNYGYMVTLVSKDKHQRRISSDDPSIRNRSEG